MCKFDVAVFSQLCFVVMMLVLQSAVLLTFLASEIVQAFHSPMWVYTWSYSSTGASLLLIVWNRPPNVVTDTVEGSEIHTIMIDVSCHVFRLGLAFLLGPTAVYSLPSLLLLAHDDRGLIPMALVGTNCFEGTSRFT
ncbi:hypothetical protein MRB53_041598 [Persea americana]|nr:hypothetical protein MRB53_041598 [Persea americana]